METHEVSGVCMALAKAGCLSDESFAKLGRLLPAWYELLKLFEAVTELPAKDEYCRQNGRSLST